jgi:hypothetical protein
VCRGPTASRSSAVLPVPVSPVKMPQGSSSSRADSRRCGDGSEVAPPLVRIEAETSPQRPSTGTSPPACRWCAAARPRTNTHRAR